VKSPRVIVHRAFGKKTLTPTRMHADELDQQLRVAIKNLFSNSSQLTEQPKFSITVELLSIYLVRPLCSSHPLVSKIAACGSDFCAAYFHPARLIIGHRNHSRRP
jgi:hypothetical protein